LVSIVSAADAQPATSAKDSSIVPPFWQPKIAAIVGIRTEYSDNRTVLGTGFFVSNRYIATAKHLVTSEYPEACLTNPGASAGRAVTRVTGWAGPPGTVTVPIFSFDTDSNANAIIPLPDTDVALIDLGPQTQTRVTLLFDPSSDLDINDTVQTYGFPLGNTGIPRPAKS
jgi:S1-C subfamily serine protease